MGASYAENRLFLVSPKSGLAQVGQREKPGAEVRDGHPVPGPTCSVLVSSQPHATLGSSPCSPSGCVCLLGAPHSEASLLFPGTSSYILAGNKSRREEMPTPSTGWVWSRPQGTLSKGRVGGGLWALGGTGSDVAETPASPQPCGFFPGLARAVWPPWGPVSPALTSQRPRGGLGT